jgi:hypothetical protein
MVFPIVPGNFIDHAIRVLSRRGVVQVHKTMAVYRLSQNRKVGSVPARRKIDYHNGPSTRPRNGATSVLSLNLCISASLLRFAEL